VNLLRSLSATLGISLLRTCSGSGLSTGNWERFTGKPELTVVTRRLHSFRIGGVAGPEVNECNGDV